MVWADVFPVECPGCVPVSTSPLSHLDTCSYLQLDSCFSCFSSRYDLMSDVHQGFTTLMSFLLPDKDKQYIDFQVYTCAIAGYNHISDIPSLFICKSSSLCPAGGSSRPVEENSWWVKDQLPPPHPCWSLLLQEVQVSESCCGPGKLDVTPVRFITVRFCWYVSCFFGCWFIF